MTKATITMCVTEALKISKETKRNFQHPFRSVGVSFVLACCVCVHLYARSIAEDQCAREKKETTKQYFMNDKMTIEQ